MQKLFFIISLLSSSVVLADTAVLFMGNDGVVLVQGKDSDAKLIYESMNVEPTGSNGKLTKEITVNSVESEPIFSLSCATAEANPNAAACIFKFFTNPRVTFGKDKKYIFVRIENPNEAIEAATKFKHQTDVSTSGEVFLSLNKRLHLWKTFSENGEAIAFSIEYRGTL